MNGFKPYAHRRTRTYEQQSECLWITIASIALSLLMASVVFLATSQAHASDAGPSLCVELTSADGEHEVPALFPATLVAHLSYHHLTPDVPHTALATLYQGGGEGPQGDTLLRTDGTPLTASVEFTPAESDGRLDLPLLLEHDLPVDTRVICVGTLSACESEDTSPLAASDAADDQAAIVLTIPETPVNPQEAPDAEAFAPTLSATLTDQATLTHLACASTNTTLVATVTAHNLVPQDEYVVRGTLCSTSLDGEEDEPVALASAETELASHREDDTVQLVFELDAREMEGSQVTLSTQLLSAGTLVAEQQAAGEQELTVSFPHMSAQVADLQTKVRVSEASPNTTLVNTVSYESLIPHKTYECRAALHALDESGSDQGELVGKDGKPASASTTFVPETAEGQLELPLTFDSRAKAGQDVVAYQQIALADTQGSATRSPVVATHGDISDQAQRVRVISISTELTDKADGDHTIAEGHVVLSDKVSYQGLTPGTTYTLMGSIHCRKDDGSDGGIVRNDRGDTIVSSTHFSPTQSSGTVTLDFAFDTSALQSSHAVAYEILYQDDMRLAGHEDISDAQQTVATTSPASRGATSAALSERMPQTGRLPLGPALLFGGMGASGTGACLLYALPRQKTRSSGYRRRRHH